MKQLRLLLVLTIGFISLNLTAQITTATLNGSVLDKSGTPLIGATVVAIHVPTGIQYGNTTREDGHFTLPNLKVGGPYTVQATYVGYKAQKFEKIRLALGQKLDIDFKLESEAVTTTEVVVTAKTSDILNNERTGAATNISNELISKLPTITRSAADYYRLTPSSDGNSFAGRNDQFNNFSLDGSIFNNPFGLDAATPGGQTDAQPVSLDAIEQIQVSLAPYDVTQAGFTGAAVNAVTKSGTNDFKGTVFGFFRNQDLTGSKVSGQDIVVPDLEQTQFGFSVGGPIIKDKVFFFANLEIERRQDLGSNFLAARPGLTGANVSRVEAADFELVADALRNRFDYETGLYEGFIHNTNNEKGLFKLDFNLGNGNTLTATYNFLNAFKDKPAHPSAIGRRGPDLITLQFQNAGYRINNKLHSVIAELNSIINNKFSNNLQIGYTSFRDTRDPFSSPFPVVNINRDGIRYIVAGHEPFSINNRLDQDVYQITNNFNIYFGAHTITIGASLERFDFNNSFNLNAYGGTFGPGFPSVQAFVDSVNTGSFDDEVAAAQATFNNNETNNAWTLAETNVGQFAFYLQDEWTVNDKLTLTYGLRMDMPLYFNTKDKIQENLDRQCCYDPTVIYYDENDNAITFDHTVLPKQTPLLSPRIGFNYDLKGDQTAQIRGGSGLFSGRFPFVWVGNQVANPNSFFYTVTHPDFNFPQVWRTNIGYDQQFKNGWTLSTDFIFTDDVNAMMVRNYGLNSPQGTLQGVDNRPVYLPTDKAANNAYVFTNTDVGNSFNFSFQMQKNWGSGLFASVGYNFLEANDASSVEAEISSDAYDRNPAFGNVNQAVSNPSLYGNRHRIFGTVYKTWEYGDWATSVAAFFQYAQGGRYSYTYSGDINRDASPLNDLIYIPTDAEIDAMTFAGDAAPQRAALKAFIAQDDYLSDRRGQYAEKYATLSPWYSQWDVRILQDYKINDGNRIQFSIDILNFGNLISSNWGVRQFPTNTQPIGVTVDDQFNPTYTFDPTLTSTYSDDFSLLSRWQMQFGLRYIFE